MAATSARHPRARRALRVAGAIAGGLLLLALAAAGGAYAWLAGPEGEAWLQRRVLSRVGAHIAGELRAARFHVHGLRLDAVGLALHAPGGEVVARADRLDDVPLLPLAGGEIVLDGSTLVGLSADVELRDGGVPLLRAVRPGETAQGGGEGRVNGGAKGGDATGGPGGLVLRDLRLEDAAVALDQGLASGLAARYAARGLGGRVTHRRGEWRISVEGRSLAPLEGPVHLGFVASAPPTRTLAVEVDAPGIAARARLTPGAPGGPRVEVERLEAAPDAARAIWPAWPLGAPVAISGSAARAQGVWTGSARAHGPAGDLTLRGRYAPATGEVPSFSLDAGDLDVGALLGRGPSTRLSGAVRGRGALGRGGPSGALAAAASGTIAGFPVETLTLQARLPAGGDAAGTLAGTFPGGRATARGALRNGALDARAEVIVRDAAALGRVEAPTPSHPLRGAGTLRLTARGPLADPAVVLEGRFDALGAGGVLARGVHVEAAVPRLSRPLALARLEVAAREVAVAGSDLDGWRLRARALRGRATVRAWHALRPVLHAAGAVAPDLREVRLEALSIRAGGTRWRLGDAARIALRAGGLEVRGLVLEAGRQRVALSGRAGADAVEARASLRAVDLAALAAAVPAAPALAGHLGAEVAISGAPRDPRASVALRVRGGPLPRLAPFESTLRASRAPGGAWSGTARVAGRGAAALARFATRDELVAAPRRTPISAHVRAGGALGALARMAGVTAPGSGRVRAEALLDGPLARPRLRARAEVRALSLGGFTGGSLYVEGSREPGLARLSGRGTVAGGPVRFQVELRDAPGGPARIAGRVQVDGVEGGPLLALAPGIRSASGRVRADLRADGTLPLPAVRGRLSIRRGEIETRGFGWYRGISLDAWADGDRIAIERLAVRSGGGALFARLRGERGGAAIALAGEARLHAFPLVTRWRLRARADADLALSGTLSPHGLRGAVAIEGAAVRLPARIGRVARPGTPPDVRIAEDLPVGAWRALDPPEAPAVPRPPPAAGAAPVELSLATASPVAVRGPGIDVLATVAPGFTLVRDGGWRAFGEVRVPSGTLRLLGSPVALLGGSEVRFAGPLSRPYLALGLRGGFEPRSVLVLHGVPGGLQLGLPPPGVTEAEVFAALAAAGPRAPPTRGPLPLVGVRLPFARLLEQPATSSYAAGTPLTSRLRVGTSGRLGADPREGENGTASWLQLRLEGSLHAQASTGDAGATAAMLVFSSRRTPPAGARPPAEPAARRAAGRSPARAPRR